MRINLVEQNYFQKVFKTFFNKSFDKSIAGISIDSRNIHKNDLFIAIKGEKFDGNDFLDQALQNGASYTLSSTRSDNYRHIFVEDLQDFLKKLCKRLTNHIIIFRINEIL